MKSTMTKVAAVAVLAAAASGAQAATLNAGDILTINAGSFTTSSAVNIAYNGGSFFGMDLNSNEKIALAEGTALAQGTIGLTVGATNTAYSPTLYGGDVTATWIFNGAPGTNFEDSVAVTGGTTGVNMGGWNVYWNGGPIDMGVGAWQYNPTNPATNNIMALQTYTNSTGNFSWSGIYGDAYTLDYTATVPTGGFATTQYYLHLEGTVQAVPEASTYGMMLAGLGLVGFAVRRRKLVA